MRIAEERFGTVRSLSISVTNWFIVVFLVWAMAISAAQSIGIYDRG